MIANVDVEGDGRVGFEEFKRMMAPQGSHHLLGAPLPPGRLPRRARGHPPQRANSSSLFASDIPPLRRSHLLLQIAHHTTHCLRRPATDGTRPMSPPRFTCGYPPRHRLLLFLPCCGVEPPPPPPPHIISIPNDLSPTVTSPGLVPHAAHALRLMEARAPAARQPVRRGSIHVREEWRTPISRLQFELSA